MTLLVSESVINSDVNLDDLFARVPGIVGIVPFEDWTVCLDHPKPPFSRKVRIRRSTICSVTDETDKKNNTVSYKWEIMEVTRKRQHKVVGQSARLSRVRQESVTSCQCSDQAQTFFESLGHKKNREYYRKGTIATVDMPNGCVVLRAYYMSREEENEGQKKKGGKKGSSSSSSSPMLLEIAAKIQDFNDSNGASRSELCGSAIRRVVHRVSRMVRFVCVPRGKKEYDEYAKYV